MEQLFEFLVVDVTDDPPRGWGMRSFRLPPARGDIITRNDDNGIGQAYEVIAVMHPDKPTSTSGELIVRHLGTDSEIRRRFLKPGLQIFI